MVILPKKYLKNNKVYTTFARIILIIIAVADVFQDTLATPMMT